MKFDIPDILTLVGRNYKKYGILVRRCGVSIWRIIGKDERKWNVCQHIPLLNFVAKTLVSRRIDCICVVMAICIGEQVSSLHCVSENSAIRKEI